MDGFRIRKAEQRDYEKVVKIATKVWSTRTDEYLLERKYGSPVLDDTTSSIGPIIYDDPPSPVDQHIQKTIANFMYEEVSILSTSISDPEDAIANVDPFWVMGGPDYYHLLPRATILSQNANSSALLPQNTMVMPEPRFKRFSKAITSNISF